MHSFNSRYNQRLLGVRNACLAIVVVLAAVSHAAAVDIVGTQNASLDQPQIPAVLQRPGESVPIGGNPGESFYISAYLDTGASGILISEQTADGLGLNRLEGVVFSDVGVGGSSDFEVSEEILVRVVSNPHSSPEQLSSYNHVVGPGRVQVGPVPGPPDPFLESLDVIGMPAMMNKVMVIDPKPLNEFLLTGFEEGGPIATYLYDPGTPYNEATSETNPGIPGTSHKVKLSYGDFERFTTISPDGSPGPDLVHNPFIGPDPVSLLDGFNDGTPPVSIGFGGQRTGGSFLLDTGAAASFISTSLASDLHVRYITDEFGDPGPDPVLEVFDPNSPASPGVVIENQFQLAIGGIGGTATLAGFFLDDMVLQTITGSLSPDDPNNIRYLGAPVLVGDISVYDPVADVALTLDGVFGMNYLVASWFINGFELGDIGLGPFDWVTFDEPNGILGLHVPGHDVPEPTSLALAGMGAALLAAAAWRRRRSRQR